MNPSSKSPRFATLLFGALFIYFVAILFHLPTLFFMAAALIAAPAVSYLLAASGLREVRAERRLPARLWPDERVSVELRIENHAWLPKCLLRVDEDLPEGLEGEPDNPPGCVVPMLWGDPFVHRYPLTARHRGRYVLPPVETTALDTFDLFRARRRVGPANELVVYPRRVPLKEHSLHAPTLDGLLQRQRPVASGIDFRATREYRPGDDLRRVHWRSTARRGKTIVMEFEEPATTDLYLVLDVSADAALAAGKDTPFETGVTAAASIIECELEHGNAVGLLFDGDEPRHLALTRERHDLLGFFEALAVVEPTSPHPFAHAIGLAAELVPSSAVVLLLSPTVDERVLAALPQLCRNHAVAFGWLDPAGYPDVPAAPRPEAALARVRGMGVSLFELRRGAVAEGLAHPV